MRPGGLRVLRVLGAEACAGHVFLGFGSCVWVQKSKGCMIVQESHRAHHTLHRNLHHHPQTADQVWLEQSASNPDRLRGLRP